MYDFLLKNEILNSQQWGFRSLHSTALALIDCSSNWLINIDKGETNLTVFLDIKKAFDIIDYEILLNKLNYYGISNIELQFFGSYLCNQKQCCNINSYKLSVKMIKYGVLQGSILGPLLFIIYMNDLPKCIDNAHITMYADDTGSSATVKTCDNIKEKVIPNFFGVIDWLKANQLSLHTVKTEFMLLDSATSILRFGMPLAIRVGDSLIRRTSCTKYLGIIMD